MTREDRALLVATTMLLSELLADMAQTSSGKAQVSRVWNGAREALGGLMTGNALHEVTAEDVLAKIDFICRCSGFQRPASWQHPPRTD